MKFNALGLEHSGRRRAAGGSTFAEHTERKTAGRFRFTLEQFAAWPDEWTTSRLVLYLCTLLQDLGRLSGLWCMPAWDSRLIRKPFTPQYGDGRLTASFLEGRGGFTLRGAPRVFFPGDSRCWKRLLRWVSTCACRMGQTITAMGWPERALSVQVWWY